MCLFIQRRHFISVSLFLSLSHYIHICMYRNHTLFDDRVTFFFGARIAIIDDFSARDLLSRVTHVVRPTSFLFAHARGCFFSAKRGGERNLEGTAKKWLRIPVVSFFQGCRYDIRSSPGPLVKSRRWTTRCGNGRRIIGDHRDAVH